MLYDFFSLCLYIIEDLKKYTCIIYASISSSIHSDIIYKTEGSSNEDGDNGDSDKNNEANKEEKSIEEEESFEIEEELKHIKNLLKLSNNARILDEKLPDSQKEKNRYLNDIREDPHVQEFFEGKTPNADDLVELQKALLDAKKEKKQELSEARKYAEDESSINSPKDQSNSSFYELDNTLNKKEDYNNYSDYKLGNSLLDYIIDILKNLFG